MLRWVLVAALAGLVVPSVAHAYGWPVKPFDRMHAIRGAFDDPRLHLDAERLPVGDFHFGVDIAVPDGTPVYAVEPGTVVVGPDWISLRRPNRREFGYWHVRAVVRSWTHVRMHQLLGYVKPGFGHVHFAESVAGVYRNPLRPGGLSPYRDPIPPVVDAIAVEPPAGHTLQSVGTAVRGTVALAADAYQLPAIEPPPPWNRARLTPSLLRWRLIGPDGDPTPWRVAVDFRYALLPAGAFFDVYAPGTYQNKPNRPGDYRFWLTRDLDTTVLPNGVYWVQVEASSFAGEVGSDEVALTVDNRPSES